jgi:hypothetical protein
MEILAKEKFIEISYESSGDYLYCNWIGFQNEESVKKGCEMMLSQLKKNGYGKVLNDNTKVTGPWQSASEWVGNVWFPQMEQAGLKHFSWVFSPNIFAELSAKKAMPASGVVKSFNIMGEAKRWISVQ